MEKIDIQIEISSRAAQKLNEGYLWVFSNEVVSQLKVDKGTWCYFTHHGKIVGTGYCNPHSLIYGRIVSSNKEIEILELLEGKLVAAFENRRDLVAQGSARLVFSESDFLPGLIVDWYGGVAVLQSNTAGIDTILPQLTELIPAIFRRVFQQDLTSFVVRCDSGIRELEGIEQKTFIVFGDEAKLIQGTFREGDVSYAADFLHGQKTGFFLDQRDNRRRWEAELRDHPSENILDLCAYSGGWGLRALKAGAKKVTFVDQSEEALRLIRRGMELNGYSAHQAEFVSSDVFDFLQKKTPGSYDAIVSDPPAFVKSKKVLPQAKKAYEKLNRLSWRALKNGGKLFTCSCSYHLSEADFLEVLRSAVAKEQGMANLFYWGGQAVDHAALLSMPETKYLKCAALLKIK